MNSTFGLGDLAFYLFRPIVYITDWIWDTDMKHCTRCKERRAKWNSWASIPRWLAIFLLTVGVFAILYMYSQ